MMLQGLYRKHENGILAGIVVIMHMILLGICFDIYYDLNDDMMMKDIMAGVYSGVPDGHNMQTLYVLGAFISLGYRLCRTIPWYGLFLCLCQFGCFYLIGMRLCGLTDKKVGKLGRMLLLSLFFWAVCLQHLVNVQYTITCAVMSGTAIFLFVTTPRESNVRQFIIKNIPSVVLVILAYQLRTEMLLLTFPFIGLAGIVRWAGEEQVFAKENWQKYGAVLGIMLAGMILFQGIDYIAYGSEEWKDFKSFFDARTTVYDFYPEVVTQDAYREDLSSLGVSETQQELLRNYNFGLDQDIDSQMLYRIAEYAAEVVGGARDWGAVLREKFGVYRYRTFHDGDAPYNMVVLWAYAAVFLAGICSRNRQMEKGLVRRYAFVWQLFLLVLMRSAIWLFILMRGRDPVRITHSLYLVEFALLAAMLINLLRTGCQNSGIFRGMLILFLLIIGFHLGDSVEQVHIDQRMRDQVNQDWYAIDDYCREREENFYFEDVYSTVSFSQKMFAGETNTCANYDILGGWISKSPLCREKYARYDIVEADLALLEKDNVYLIVSDVEAKEQGFDWIIGHYAQNGISVTVQESDRINENYRVYHIDRVK